jgi:hypothetical protein
LTVALLGVVITMVSARSVNEPDPRRQKVTMALLPVPAALAITAAALLAPHIVAADVMFVVVVFTAVYIRRFGPRGMALGMVTFMSYFFSLYLRAKATELPWLISAGGRHVQLRVERVPAARPARSRAATHGAVTAGADGHRRRHHRRDRSGRPARRTATTAATDPGWPP